MEQQEYETASKVKLNSTVLQYPQIASLIFENLSAQNLSVVGRVWCSQAKLELQKRHQLHWDLFEGDNETDIDGVASQICDSFQRIPIRPRLMVLFVAFKARCMKIVYSNKIVTLFKRRLPPHCRVMYIVGEGVIGTSSDLSRTVEIQDDAACNTAAVLYVGNLQSGDVNIFDMPESIQGIEAIYNFLDSNARPDVQDMKDMKALLMFCRDVPASPRTVSSYKAVSLYQHLLVAGGVTSYNCVDTSSRHPPQSRSKCVLDSTYLAIQGRDTKVLCAKFPRRVVTREEAEGVVMELKGRCVGVPTHRSVAFMFSCIGRGMYTYSEANVESAAFRKHFPNVPILGFFGNGEIGEEYPYVKRCQSFTHTYTTFIVLVSFP